MKNDILKIAVVGNPNKGKSSFVSNMAYDDSLKISNKSGETTKKSVHPLIIENKIIYELYDTPGFYNDEEILNYITFETTLTDIKSILKKCINEKKDDEDFSLDIEILEVLIESDIIVYIADSSEYNPSLDKGLEIIKRLNLPSFIVFNNKSKDSKDKSWEDIEKKYFLASFEYNVLESSFNNKLELLDLFLNKIDEDKLLNKLREAIEVLKRDFDDRLKYSFDELSSRFEKMISYRLEYTESFTDTYTKDFLHKSKKDDFFKELNKIEENFFLSIEKKWGFENIDKYVEDFKNLSLEEDDYTKTFGVSTAKLIFLGIGAGAGIGMTIDTLAPTLGLGTLIGALSGGVTGIVTALAGVKVLNAATRGYGKEKITTLSLKRDSYISIVARMYYYIEQVSKRTHATRNKFDFRSEENLSEKLFDGEILKKINKNISEFNFKELSDTLYNNYKKRLQ